MTVHPHRYGGCAAYGWRMCNEYKDLDTATHTARKLQSEFERSADDSTERINRTVSEVILYTDLTVGIILLNGQLMRKENDT